LLAVPELLMKLISCRASSLSIDGMPTWPIANWQGIFRRITPQFSWSSLFQTKCHAN
jgi:hypothetical protein